MRPRATEFQRDARVLALALIALLAWEASGLDLVFVRWYGNSHGFAWRDAWLTSKVLHEGGRVLAWGLLAIMFAYVWWPLTTGPSRAERMSWLAVTFICLLLIPPSSTPAKPAALGIWLSLAVWPSTCRTGSSAASTAGPVTASRRATQRQRFSAPTS